jgi:hypothetical protein
MHALFFFTSSSNSWLGRLAVGLLLLSWLGLGTSCFPPDHPEPDHPPCVKSVNPTAGQKLPLGSSFTLTFSKELSSESTTNEFIFLVDGTLSFLEQRDLESPDSVSQSLQNRIVSADITVTSGKGEATVLKITPQRPLLGDRTYTLLVTRGTRDKQSRPLNRCPDANGISVADVGSYKTGLSYMATFTTQSSPGEPRIVEVQANQPVSNGRFVEVINLSSAKGALNLASYTLSGGGKARTIRFLGGNGGEPSIKPGERAVIVEPDYDRAGNPLNIPSSVPIFTTNGSTSTMVDGGMSGKSVVSLRKANGDVVDSVSPGDVSDGEWPKDKSMEKCDPAQGNNKSNWKASSDSNGTPGKTNGC